MFTIELTRERTWNAPAIETHAVEKALHVAEVERLAERLLMSAQRRGARPTGYRVIDATGRRIREK